MPTFGEELKDELLQEESDLALYRLPDIANRLFAAKLAQVMAILEKRWRALPAGTPGPTAPELFTEPETFEQVLGEVVLRTGVSAADLVGPSKLRRMVQARALLAHELRMRLRWSYAAVGRHIHRSHSATLNLCRMADKTLVVAGEPT
jgi:hypothetical protein